MPSVIQKVKDRLGNPEVNSYKVGDHVTINGTQVTGVVDQVGWWFIYVMTLDEITAYHPNELLITKISPRIVE